MRCAVAAVVAFVVGAQFAARGNYVTMRERLWAGWELVLVGDRPMWRRAGKVER